MDDSRLQMMLNLGSVVLIAVLVAAFITIIRAAFSA